MTTLEEAIERCDYLVHDLVEFCNSPSKYIEQRRYESAVKLRQLAEWLRELKELRIENKALKNRCADFEHGAPCRYCPLDCEFRKNEFEERDDDW